MTKEEFVVRYARGYIGDFEAHVESIIEEGISAKLDKARKGVTKVFNNAQEREDRVELADVLEKIK